MSDCNDCKNWEQKREEISLEELKKGCILNYGKLETARDYSEECLRRIYTLGLWRRTKEEIEQLIAHMEAEHTIVSWIERNCEKEETNGHWCIKLKGDYFHPLPLYVNHLHPCIWNRFHTHQEAQDLIDALPNELKIVMGVER